MKIRGPGEHPHAREATRVFQIRKLLSVHLAGLIRDCWLLVTVTPGTPRPEGVSPAFTELGRFPELTSWPVFKQRPKGVEVTDWKWCKVPLLSLCTSTMMLRKSRIWMILCLRIHLMSGWISTQHLEKTQLNDFRETNRKFGLSSLALSTQKVCSLLFITYIHYNIFTSLDTDIGRVRRH